jgi:hypothetical protein
MPHRLIEAFIIDRTIYNRNFLIRNVGGKCDHPVGRNPSGLEIHAVVDALEPIDGTTMDRDLWAILRSMIGGVGGSWTVEDFDRTGRLYRVPAAPPG